VFDTIFGLPAHPLVVHATVVIVPSASLAVGLAALWPRFRAWAGWLPLLLSVMGVILVPVSTSSGESLEENVQDTALLEKHVQLGEGLLVWAIIMAVGAAALFVIQGRERKHGEGSRSAFPRAVVVGAIVVALVGVVGTTVQVARIGHSGAKAAWSDTTGSAQLTLSR
jgi:hypothetical protein